MEHNGLDYSIAGASAESLQDLTTVCTEDLDDRAALGSRSDQRAVGVYTEGTELRLVRLDHTIHAVLRH